MAFFLKQTPLKGRTYLAIYESFYSREKKGTAHRTYKSLGSIETHKANGMDGKILRKPLTFVCPLSPSNLPHSIFRNLLVFVSRS